VKPFESNLKHLVLDRRARGALHVDVHNARERGRKCPATELRQRALFRADATFCPQAGQSGQGTSFASFNFPTRFIRHFNNTVYIASNGGPNAFDASASWAADVSWVVSSPWTP
jgi:hypothetical protein